MLMRQIIKVVLVIDALLIAFIVFAGLYTYFQSTPTIIEAEESGITVSYSVDRSHILSLNECLNFSWEVHNISAIYFNDAGVGGFDHRIVCNHNAVPLSYTLRVNGQNDEELNYVISLEHVLPLQHLMWIGLPLIVYFIYLAFKNDVIHPRQSVTVNRKKWFHFLIYLAVIISPVLIISLYLFTRHTANILQLMPSQSDGLIVWHQAQSFARAGFDTGYYTVNEVPAKVSFFHFYAWGPFVSMLYGSVIKLIGASLSSIVVANQIFITLAMLAYVMLIRPNIKQSFLLMAIFALYSPYVIYATISMDVLLQLAMAIGISAGFWRLIDNDNHPSDRFKYGLGITLLLAAYCVRPTWGLLLFPYAYFAFPKRRISALIIAVILFLGGIITQSFVSAPFPSFRNQVLRMAESDMFGAVNIIIRQLLAQVTQFFKISQLEVLTSQRVQSILIMMFSGFATAFALYQRKKESVTTRDLYLWCVCLYVIVSVYALLNAVIDVSMYTEIRWVAPYLMMIIVLLIAARRYIFVLLILATMLAYLPATFNEFDQFAQRGIDPLRHELFAITHDALEPVLHYDSETENQWCNTVLFDLNYIEHPALLSIDSGIGLSLVHNWDIHNLKSKYFIVKDVSYEAIEQTHNVRLLHEIRQARLYLNLDADCVQVSN